MNRLDKIVILTRFIICIIMTFIGVINFIFGYYIYGFWILIVSLFECMLTKYFSLKLRDD